MTTNFVVKSKGVFGALLLVVVLQSVSALSQGQPSQITEPIDNNILVRLPRTHHPLAISVNDRGRLDGAAAMGRMMLILKPSDQQAAALARLINQQHDRQAPNYRSWVTPEAYGAQFGPSEAELDQVTGWLQQQGFRIERVARGKQWVEFSGNAAQVEAAFHTEMHRYVVSGEEHVANATDISVPRALAPLVSGVLTLHNFRKHPAHIRAFQLRRDSAGRLSRVAQLAPNQHGASAAPISDITVGSSTHYLTPGDYSRIYNTLPLLNGAIDGTDVAIAIVGRTDINLSDVQTFRQIFGLPVNDPTFIVNGADPGVNGDEIESALDVEWAGAVAPKAAIKFVSTQSTFTTDGVDLSASYIVDNVVAPIMSTSYGQCEAFLGNSENAFYNLLYQQAAAEGITAFVSAGDNGPAGCDYPVSFVPAQNGRNVSGLASTPYNVAVGGTEFSDKGADSTYWLTNNRPDLSSAIGYIPEAVWNESCDPTTDPNQCQGTFEYFLWSGSGGASSCSQSSVSGNQITCLSGYAKPAWQAGTGVPNDGVRDLPDLALAAAGAHDGYLVCLEGSCQTIEQNGQTILERAAVVGGTSASSPSMAGVMALVEQKNGAFQGLANYTFYQLAASERLWQCNSSKLTDPTKTNSCVFYDTTAGNNNVPGQLGFNAARGYDMATGLGSVNATNLANAWNSVQKLWSTSSLSASVSTIQHGTPLPLNVVVQPATGTGAPSGDFSVETDKHGAVFGGTLANGTFAGGVNGLAGGHYSIKAHYAGDAMFGSSDSAGVPITVTPEPSATNASGWEVNLAGFVVPIFGPVNYAQPVAIQFNVQGNSGIGSATGNATVILDDSVNLGTYPLNQGGSGWVEVDNLTPTGLLPGNHHFQVLYSGDNSFGPSLSPKVPVAVRKVLPNGFAAPIPATVTVGTPVRLLFAVLSPGNLVPTGTIDIYDNNKKIGGPITLGHSGLVGAGLAQVSYTASGLAVGSHEFHLTYSGDAVHLPLAMFGFSNHGAFVTVNAATGAATQVSLVPSQSSIPLGGTVNYSVTVKPAKAGGPMPTGAITLVGENGGPFAPAVNLSNGSATVTLDWSFVVKDAITAAYSGDSSYSASNSPVIVTTVTQGAPTVTLAASSATVVAGTESSLTVATLGMPSNPNVSVPYGEVIFFDSLDGGAQRRLGGGFLTTGNGGNPVFTLPVILPPGTHRIYVKYSGSPDWKAADSNSVTIVAH
jgi:hypothetical protein